jgi:tetratricopeptide (TPR) repeat protein
VAREAADAAIRLGRRELEATAHWLAGLTALFREDVDAAEQELSGCLDRLAGVDTGSRPFFPAASAALTLMPVGADRLPVFEETALIGRRVGAVQAAGYVHSAIGSAHRLARRPADAQASVQAAVRTFESVGDLTGIALALNHLGCVERDLGDPAALGHLAEALRLRTQLGDRRAATVTLANQGLAEAALGEPDGGRESLRTALARAEAIEDRPGEAGTLLNLAAVELIAGELHAARTLAGEATNLFGRQGYRRMDALAVTFAGQLAAREGDVRTARRHADRAGQLFADMRCGPGVARAAALAAAAKAR